MSYRNAAVSAVLILAGTASAQQQDQGSLFTRALPQATSDTELNTKPKREVEYSLLAYGIHQFHADLSANQEGDVTVSRFGAAFQADIPQGERGTWRIDAGSEFSNYDWKGSAFTTPPYSEPFDDVIGGGLGARYTYQIDKHWSGFGGVAITTWGENGAQFSDTITWGVQGGAEYKFDEDLKIGLWIGVNTELEETLNYLIVPLIDWQIDDHWWLKTSPIGIRSAGAELGYDIDRNWSIILDSSYQNRTFRLNADPFAPEGAVRDIFVPVNIGARWKPTHSDIEIQAQVGVQAFQEYRVQDSNGNTLNTYETQFTPVFSFAFRWNF